MRTARTAARDAIDRELAKLTAGLPDPSRPPAVDRITRLRQWRDELVGAVQGVTERADVPAVRLSDEDGPDEIQQKADLVSDMAAQLQGDADAVRKRLKELELERRLRGRLSSFASEVSLFDEDVAQARSVAGGQVGADEKVLAGGGEEAGRAPGAAGRCRLEQRGLRRRLATRSNVPGLRRQRSPIAARGLQSRRRDGRPLSGRARGVCRRCGRAHDREHLRPPHSPGLHRRLMGPSPTSMWSGLTGQGNTKGATERNCL